MADIVYCDTGRVRSELNIAGDFNGWTVEPMVRREGEGEGDGPWVYHLSREQWDASADKKFQFKFVDTSGNWFTLDDFPVEADEHNNVNNVVVLEIAEETGEETGEELGEETGEEATETVDDGPEAPTPSLKNVDISRDETPEQPEEHPSVQQSQDDSKQQDNTTTTSTTTDAAEDVDAAANLSTRDDAADTTVYQDSHSMAELDDPLEETCPDETRPDETRPDETQPDESRAVTAPQGPFHKLFVVLCSWVHWLLHSG
ncbi:Uip4p KNAG_0M00420 [Huiozyma naganishii CBS 8797]|uniref:AMP-activated protein kinase glycogen-binding domain-containing protein n=1 Tax=Huiozyma naganishii (strain ATCC MYA-139 / BCRC 22969 / CBS 8797 / KCTC 17520 / NBRC 10181 / NCYC 3082 / Yp74L-3) TaxID=1071383 RepID=J7RDD5_HUIN7|nr:hypothetical protein KNAG_0M00420 [Kazachstania naganishii CBS 8797]CCK72895.1 hypothetical protein KNAG_0M00420 [Kazachstania naganishii CBS 8797]